MLIRKLSLVVFGFTLFYVFEARAQSEEENKTPDYTAAKAYFKAGQAFLQANRYGEAIVEFKKAYEITGDGLVMGQIADAYAKAGDYENALKSIKIYRSALPVDERAESDDLVNEYEQAIQQGKSKQLLLPGEKASTPPIDIVTEEEKTTADQPTTSASAAKIEKSDATAPTNTTPKTPDRFYTWVALGSAGVLAVSAMVVGINAQNKYDELAGPAGCKPNCTDSDVNSVKTRAIITDALLGAAVLAGVTAGVLYFFEGRPVEKQKQDSSSSQAAIKQNPYHLRFAPLVTKSTYGVHAGINF